MSASLPKKRGLLACVCFGALVVLANATCNSAILNFELPDGCPGDKNYRGGVVSASSFSESFTLASGLWVLPQGGVTPMLDVDAQGTPSLYGRTVASKHAAVCLSHDAVGIAKLKSTYDAATWNVPDNWYICNQGMNDKGLAVSFQANHPEPVPAYDAAQGPNAIHFFDMPKVVLTQFSTVAEVEAAYDYQIVSNPIYGFFGETARTQSAQWLAIYDATGAAAVIEFVGGGGPRFVRNPLGVLANDPGFLEDHIKNYTSWLDARGISYDPTTLLINGPVSTAPDGTGTASETAKGAFKAPDVIPGGYDGDARFIRMGMLKSAALAKGCWPDPVISPSSAQARRAGYPALLPSMLAAKDVIDSVALPLGLTDFGEMNVVYEGTGSDWRQDATFWYTMRDHVNMLFLWRPANNLAYRSFDLKRFGADGAEVAASGHGKYGRRHNKHGRHASRHHGGDDGGDGNEGASDGGSDSASPRFIPLVGLPNPGIVDVTQDYLGQDYYA